MQKNFDLVLYGVKNAVNTMQGCILECIKKDKRGIFPNERNMQWEYVSFELFVYLLVYLEVLVLKHQDERIRKPLFFYIADNVLKTLNIEKGKYYSILRLRMDEYVSIEVDNELEANKKTEMHLDRFIGNLAYAVFKKDLYQWKDSIKTMPALDIVNYSTIRSLYNDKLISIYDSFIITHKNLFTAKSDFTKLSAEELATIRKNTRKEIRETTSKHSGV
ncbi:MAG: hypothetical protein ACXADH_15605 [Candidatus Kariarchaeaceae archaeon]